MNLKKITRVATIGLISGLLAVAGPMASAHAATEPTFPTGSDAKVWLVDATNNITVPAGTQLAWNDGQAPSLSAISTSATPVDYEPTRLPFVSGALQFVSFISDPGHERTVADWKASGTTSTLDGIGALLPEITPSSLTNGGGAAVKTAGGTYSLGIAYLNNGGLTVVAAYYTTINVDAGTGTWKFATPTTDVVVTDVHTTTTLAANPTSVELGAKTTLTATVTAENSASVSGNVQFYDGATLLGTVGASNGVATKDVTVGTAGDHTYTATFVQTTVGANRFLASTSAPVTVAGVTGAVTLPPKAPSQNALNATTANGASATIDNDQVVLTVPAALNGTPVNVFAYSTPTYLGQLSVADGSITVDVSSLPAGNHDLAITDPGTGDVLAWASFTKTTDAAAQTITKTINAEVANNSTPSDGEFSLTNLSGDTVTLDNPTLVNGESVSSGELGLFKVTDLRVASHPGWTLSTTVADFVKGSDQIDNSQLGIAPKVIDQAGSGATAPTLGAAQVSGSASYPWDFAELAAGGYSGSTSYNADLTFTAPAGSAAGTYTSTLTLTLVSQ